MGMTDYSWQCYAILAIVLFIGSFGVSALFTLILITLCFFIGAVISSLDEGRVRAPGVLRKLGQKLNSYQFSAGLTFFLENRNKYSNMDGLYGRKQAITNCASLDAILEQILNYVIRDFIDCWYGNVTTDHLFQESLKRSARRSLYALSQCIQKVDFGPLLTQHIVDDFASHFRLFRKAKERANLGHGKQYTAEDLETIFFDLELEMEQCYCRDLVSTCPQYENAYLHDVMDILLYLLMPSEDFRSRPLRFVMREVFVQRILLPLLDILSDPDYINHSLVWLMSETNLKPEDFIATLESSVSLAELDALLDSLCEEATHLRAKDAGGEQGFVVKQQLASIDYAINIIKRRMDTLNASSTTLRNEKDMNDVTRQDTSLIQLPIYVVLTNNTAVSYFADYLSSVGGQNLIDCYLAIEGFKVSVEHQLRGLAAGETVESDTYETIKEAANFLYQQYLSQEAVTRVSLEGSVISRLLSVMRGDDPPDVWFEEVQSTLVNILLMDDRFYNSFKKDQLYMKMLVELGINGKVENENSASDESGIDANSSVKTTKTTEYENSKSLHEGMHAVIETLGIGQQGKQTFALYNVRVFRIDSNGKQTSKWNVLRRYSDFHALHSLIQSRSILKPTVLRDNPELETMIYNFLSVKEYVPDRGALSKKVMNAMFEPIKSGVRAFGNAVTSVPDTVFDGVTRVGDGINRAAKQIINYQPQQGVYAKDEEFSRVAAIYSDQQWIESIPLRVLVLLISEVFGVRSRSAWFRRRLVALIHQFVHATMGSSLNRKIIDIVQWLTSKQQVAQYLTAFRNALWPGGQLSNSTQTRSSSEQLRCRLLARALMLSALPDELRLLIGAESTNIGIANVSELLQNKRLNRRLLYVVFERLLVTVFPNNRFDKIFPQLHSKSPRSRPFQA